MTRNRIILLAVAVVAIVLFFFFDLHQVVTLENAQAQRESVLAFYRENPIIMIVGFAMLYIAVTGLSLPGAAILTLVAGAIFDLLVGVVLVSFASTIGASLAFLLARYLFRDFVQGRFSKYLKPINEGVEKDGAFYLFALRLVPLFPFVVINVAMALTPIRLWTFFFVSQIGMLAGTVVYVNAGSQLGQLDSLTGILSPMLIGSFVLLGLFPLLAKKGLDLYRAKFRDGRTGSG